MKTGLAGILILALLMLLGAARQVHAQAAATPALDPAIWGVYAKVVGRDWMHQEYKRKKHWRWEDGKIIEEYVDHEPGYGDGKAVVERGADPGRLTYSEHVNGINHMWDGVVSPDGSVLWIKRSIFKLPFRVRMEGKDIFVEEWVKFRGDVVVPTKYVERYAAIATSSNAEVAFADANAPSDGLAQIEVQQEEERKIESERKRQEWHDYEARMSGLYNVLQVTGAIIDVHAAQTQAELAATIAQGQAQGLAQRQQQQAEAAAQAAAAQRQNEVAESARLDEQNRANLASLEHSLLMARRSHMDPAFIATIEQAVTTAKEALNESGGAGNDNSAQLAEQQRQQTEAERQAAARAEQERLAAAKQREAERAQREADRRRQEELANQKQQQALQDQLAAERRGIQLRALKCPGIGNQITGLRPRITPRIADCVTVQFEARCPGTQPGQGVTGSFYNFIGSTGNISCANDTIELPAGLSCPAEQVRVDVREVIACN
jgi:hypothetical protein